MATIAIPQGSGSATGLAALYGRPTKTIVKIVDLVNAAAVKGSALAQDDVIQAVAIPANSVISKVYCRVLEAADVGTLNVDIGTGVDADAYVDGQTITTLGLLQTTPVAMGVSVAQASTGTLSFVGTLNFTATYDTVDVTLMTFTGTTPTTGQIAVFVEIADLTVPAGANIADIQ